MAFSVLGAVAPAFARPSNPAFLGVAMDMANHQSACPVTGVTPHSPAQAAGLRPGDVIVAIDATPITSCNALLAKIQQHGSGDTIKIKVDREGAEPTLEATLITREDILRRRGIVGQRVIATSMITADRQIIDLSDTRRRTTIVGWFDSSCIGCEQVFSQVARWSSKHSTKTSPIRVLGALGDGRGTDLDLEDLKLKQRSFDVPLAFADDDTREAMTLADSERVYFMVIDHRGIVQHIAPVSPDADDVEAMLDGLFATAEQCARKLK